MTDTGALFVAATAAGAAAAGVDPGDWELLGEKIGEAYQVADDLLDRFGDPDVIGKPVGQDAANDRPNVVSAMGVGGATEYLAKVIDDVVGSVPDCPGKQALSGLIRDEATSIMNAALKGRAAA